VLQLKEVKTKAGQERKSYNRKEKEMDGGGGAKKRV